MDMDFVVYSMKVVLVGGIALSLVGIALKLAIAMAIVACIWIKTLFSTK